MGSSYRQELSPNPHAHASLPMRRRCSRPYTHSELRRRPHRSPRAVLRCNCRCNCRLDLFRQGSMIPLHPVCLCRQFRGGKRTTTLHFALRRLPASEPDRVARVHGTAAQPVTRKIRCRYVDVRDEPESGTHPVYRHNNDSVYGRLDKSTFAAKQIKGEQAGTIPRMGSLPCSQGTTATARHTGRLALRSSPTDLPYSREKRAALSDTAESYICPFASANSNEVTIREHAIKNHSSTGLCAINGETK